MIFGEYYHALDRDYGEIEPADTPPGPGQPLETSDLGPQEIGTGTNPMMNQLQAFNAKIREGASKIEFEFMGAGKSDSQRPSPEAFGTKEREDMRALAEINEIKTSVHAPLHTQSLAGLGEQGFSDQARQMAIKEIERAINFSAEATKGGAVVFHTSEWQRPLSDIKEITGESLFRGYKEEEEKAPVMVADSQTGNISAVRKDYYVYEPRFHSAKSYEKVLGRKLIGTIDKYGNKVEADDWVDVDGNAIKHEWILDPDKSEELFNRVPIWNKERTDFEVERVTYKDFIGRAKELEEKTNKKIAPEVLFFKTQTANKVLQAKGHSLFYARDYERQRELRDVAKKALDFYERLESKMPEEEKWNLMINNPNFRHSLISELIPSKDILPSEFLKQKIKEYSDNMRHIHEASAAADAQAKEALEQMNRIQTVENYGRNKVAETIAQSGIKAMQFTDQHTKELNEPIYVAPENWRPEQYGSHPDEIRDLIIESRKKMQEQLMKEGYGEEEAKAKAKEHIKATVDVGHFNLWRQHFVAREGETPEKRNKRFDEWLLKETKKLADEGILGHVHLTDNMGYDDEHLTPGEGNIPMKEFIKNMEEAGLKDFIAEAGSYNATRVMTDTWALMGSPIYTTTKVPTFRSVHEQHFGYHNPSTYIVGAYAPSNEWRLWSEVPLE